MLNKFSILNGEKYFSLGIFQSYLVFISIKKYIKYFSGTTRIKLWKSNRMPEESINFAPIFVDHYLVPDMNFNGRCLITNNFSIAKKVINLYISYTLGLQLRNLNTYFTLGNCLFGSIKLTQNPDLDKHKYSGYNIEWILAQNFYLQMWVMEKNHYFWSWQELICACW